MRAAVVIVAIAAFWLQATAVEFLANVGTPLTREVLEVSLREAVRVLGSGVRMTTHASVWAACGSALIALFSLSKGRLSIFLNGAVSLLLSLLILGLLGRWHWRQDYAFSLLRSPLFRTVEGGDFPDEAASSGDAPVLECGARDRTALDAIDWPAQKIKRVVMLVLESVGSRFVKDLSPLGSARMPNLARLIEQGSINFTNASALGPWSVQSAWALTYGMYPPVKPFGFSADIGLPRPGAIPLQVALRRRGASMAHVNAGQLAMWGFRKVVNTPPPDYLAEADDLQQSEGLASIGWGANDRSIFSAGLRWLHDLGNKPGLLVLWNIQTHYPFNEGLSLRPDVGDPTFLARYVAAIERSDALLGSFLDTLNTRHELEDTVFIVAGDHGEGFARFGRAFDLSHGSTVTEDAVRVPLIISYAGLKGRRLKVETPVSHADLYPTVVDLLSSGKATGVDGQSLVGALESRPLVMRANLFWPAALRCGQEKLIRLRPGLAAALYDTDIDPEEMRDLAPDRPRRAGELSRYLSWQQHRGRRDPWYDYGGELLARRAATASK